MSESTNTRPSLLLRIRDAHDAESWRQFEACYGDLIIRYCRRRGIQLADAEDIRQLVLAKLARSLRRFEYDPARGRFRDYLGLCVRNAIATEARRHKLPLLSVFPGNEALQSAPAAEEAADWNDEWVRHHYRRAMRTLGRSCDPQTLAVFEAILDGGAPEAIARRFGISHDAVRKIKQRVRDRLRAIISAQLHDEDADR